jgi:auxin efflux carrier family protein
VISLLTSMVIALVPQLKALFVDTTASGGPAWHGPDGRPPLAFALDTARFVGAVSIPLSLILLGVSFARIRIPRPLTRLPIPAMLYVMLAKMFVLPVFGILVVRAMTNGGMIPKEALAERFVAMILSGTPGGVKCVVPTRGEMQAWLTRYPVNSLSHSFIHQMEMLIHSRSVLHPPLQCGHADQGIGIPPHSM